MDEPKKAGPPFFPWTQEIEDEIFDRLAKGEAIRNICKDDWLPSWQTFSRRLAGDEALRIRYARAREEQADKLFDECLEIADQYDQSAEKTEGGTDHIARAKLRIDTRKWMAGKLRPRVYGDKMDLSGNVGFTVTIAGDDAEL